eukprot:m.111197 g.111197  ORF g.111197 m.111197 type:complete len:341 (+) comp16997_c0_seq2:208-1230(+)
MAATAARSTLRIGVLSDIPKLTEMVSARVAGTAECIHLDTKTLAERSETCIDFPVLLADPNHAMTVLPSLNPTTQWISLTWAGVEKIIEFHRQHDRLHSPPWRLTRFAGAFGPAMGEYVVGSIIARERGFADYTRAQDRAQWRPGPSYRCLNELSISILGAGAIGADVAKYCRALGMQVKVLVRDLPAADKHVEEVEYIASNDEGQLEGLEKAMRGTDYICNILPSTPHTRGLLGSGRLANWCKHGACFINVGRGDVITEDELIAALNGGSLGGAILDVFAQEPLPATSPLWTHPSVTVTPHRSAVSFPHQVADAFAANLARFQTDPSSLAYQVDLSRGY